MRSDEILKIIRERRVALSDIKMQTCIIGTGVKKQMRGKQTQVQKYTKRMRRAGLEQRGGNEESKSGRWRNRKRKEGVHVCHAATRLYFKVPVSTGMEDHSPNRTSNYVIKFRSKRSETQEAKKE